MDTTTCPTCEATRNSWKMDESPADWQAAHDARLHRSLEVLDGVTQNYPQDSYGYAVVARTPKTATLVPLPDPQSLGLEPVESGEGRGGFPVWSHTYTAEQIEAHVNGHRPHGPAKKATLRKDGCWYFAGSSTPLVVNGARYHRDYSH